MAGKSAILGLLIIKTVVIKFGKGCPFTAAFSIVSSIFKLRNTGLHPDNKPYAFSNMKIAVVFILSLLGAGNLYAQNLWLDSNVTILLPAQPLPSSAQKLGDFKFRQDDAAVMESSYRKSLFIATQKTLRLHGNLVFITSIKAPGTFRPSWQVDGEIYTVGDIRALRTSLQQQRDSILQTALAASNNESIIVCYRNYDNTSIRASAMVNDSSIANMKFGQVVIVRIPAGKEAEISAGRKQARRLKVTGKPGEVFFVKIQVNLSQGKYAVSINGAGGNIPDANAQILLTEPRLGWEEVQVLLKE